MKCFRAAVCALVFCIGLTVPAYSAQWIAKGDKWAYQLDDGSLQKNGWATIDGKEYYFNESGIMLSDTITPDGYGLEKSGEKKQRLGVYSDKQQIWTDETVTFTATFGNWNETATDVSWKVKKGDVEIVSVSEDKRSAVVRGNGAGEFKIAATVRTKTGINCETERGGMVLDKEKGGWVKNEDGDWTYMENGELVKNAWRSDRSNMYYLDENGIMAVNRTVVTPEGTFTFDRNGKKK